MAEKAQTPPPIDQPVSKSYLREFEGWSTAYPPGVSSPASLRMMENVLITREGGARVRPALRSVLPQDTWMDPNYSARIVGGWEHFILNDGSRAILFAARQAGGSVKFYVGKYDPATKRYIVIPDISSIFNIPGGESALNFPASTTFIRYLQIDNKILALSDSGEPVRIFYVGANKKARLVTSISLPNWSTAHALSVVHPAAAWINSSSKTAPPSAQTPTATTLVSSTAANNTYNYGFFYTFENELGESAPSQITTIRAQRGWSQWEFFAPDGSGNRGAAVTLPEKSRDQFVASIPLSVYNDALNNMKALKWNLYMFTWSDQAPVPYEAVLVATKEMVYSGSSPEKDRWLQATLAIDLGGTSVILPTEENRVNYSKPPTASQGLVAGDRLILVNDREDGALIRWSSNRIGEYTNFSPSKGGGYKTLTSGNLLIPVTAKLWQNPQSVDTVTILCTGLDGAHASYYMAPATVEGGMTSGVSIMAFEETTATPGTVSPYGVEVLNNALYHPLDTELMKSTAANYVISHTTMSLDIANKWVEIERKQDIISSQHDNRLYYIVNNPEGEELEDGCKGNEIWVYDAAKEAGTWSRWLVQAISIGKLEIGGKLYVAVARPEGIFVFDEYKLTDDAKSGHGTIQKPIPWKLETNTQGANRAHDIWAKLHQANVTVGNLRGSFKYGIRGQDVHGRTVEVSKIVHHPIDDEFHGTCGCQARLLPFELDDYMKVEKTMKEWFFFAESIEENGEVVPSFGQINYVQYTVMPASVNIGYNLGSLETFEYRRNVLRAPETTAYNGVPLPIADHIRY